MYFKIFVYVFRDFYMEKQPNFLSFFSALSLTCIARPVNLISLQPHGSKRFKSFSDNELDCFLR